MSHARLATGNAPRPSERRDTRTSIDPEVQAQIGRKLRAVYDGIVSQPVPDRFLALLDALDGQEPTRPEPTLAKSSEERR